MRVFGCSISDEDGSIRVEWYEESEQKPEGGTFYQTVITREAIDNWEHVGYYAKELIQDLEELVEWTLKYTSGKVK